MRRTPQLWILNLSKKAVKDDRNITLCELSMTVGKVIRGHPYIMLRVTFFNGRGRVMAERNKTYIFGQGGGGVEPHCEHWKMLRKMPNFLPDSGSVVYTSRLLLTFICCKGGVR